MALSQEMIEKIIDKANSALLSSINENGFPNTRAMLPPRKRVGLKEFYFSTNTSSLKVRQFQKNSKACLYFYTKRFYQVYHNYKVEETTI